MKQLCQDLSLDLMKYIEPTATESDLKGFTFANFGVLADQGASTTPDPGYWCPLGDSEQPARLQLEHDVPEALVPAAAVEASNVQAFAEPVVSEADRTMKLFPNAFQISGLKHVCDNLCGAVLAGLPQLLGQS